MTIDPSRVASAGFEALFAAMKLLRPVRPIHPRGVRLRGTLTIAGPAVPSGIGWVDTPGTGSVTARFSRSVGLPEGLPDILGLALRTGPPDAPADVLLASTGVSAAGRFLLMPRLHAAGAPLTTLMPYKGAAGPVLLGAWTTGAPGPLPAALAGFRQELDGGTWSLELRYSRLRGPWAAFGGLDLTLDPDQEQEDLRFDPVLNPLPGAGTYSWAAQLRARSYAVARAPGRLRRH